MNDFRERTITELKTSKVIEPKEIVLPVRVSWNSPCLKDATNRVIIRTPERFLRSDIDPSDIEQWLSDLDDICVLMNRGLDLV